MGYLQLSMSGNILDYNMQLKTGRLYQNSVSELTYSYILLHEVIEVIQSYLRIVNMSVQCNLMQFYVTVLNSLQDWYQEDENIIQQCSDGIIYNAVMESDNYIKPVLFNSPPYARTN